MRFSRHCYDKPHRCPGWAGGGMKSAKRDQCKDGRLRDPDDWSTWKRNFRFHRCTDCDVIVIPHVTRWLDLGWLRWTMCGWWRDLRYWWEMRRRE